MIEEIKLSDLPTWNSWDIGCVLDKYAKAIAAVDDYTETNAIRENFIKLIRLQVINDGHVMFTEDFAKCVKNGGFTSYDGCGYYLDKNGEECEPVNFKVKDILKNAETFPYVCWYNK